MNNRITIFGYGPVGKATAALALKQGREVVVAQRKAPSDLVKGAIFQAGDALDADAVLAATRGSDHIVVAIGLPYYGKVWRENWPRVMANLIAACEATGARMVFVDNLYMYGPQTAPLVESMPLTDYGVKPATRALITRTWMAAAAAGRIRAVSLRAPDFYGPGVGLSHLGDPSIGALAKGKRALCVGSPDLPHDFAYVPDIGRAVVTLLDAPDSAYGQAWHAPSAPTETRRRLIDLAAAALGRPATIVSMPIWALGVGGLFSADLKEIWEMRFQWDRPYRVDASRFAKAFWNDPTPFEVGVRATALAFQRAVRGEARDRPIAGA